MLTTFPEEGDAIRDLFRTLLYKGKRDVRPHPNHTHILKTTPPSHPQEIRGLFRVCNKHFEEDQYDTLRQYLYNYTTGKLNHRQLLALCEVRRMSPGAYCLTSPSPLSLSAGGGDDHGHSQRHQDGEGGGE